MANKITVTSAGTVVNANVTPDTAMYYSNKSKEWATSNRIVDNTDYSSKYYANESKKQADISTAKATEVVESGNTAVLNIENARDNAIMDVNTAGATQVALATEQATIATNKANEVVESVNTALSDIDTAKDNAIISITNQETTSKTSLIDEGATQIGLIQNEGATQVANVQSTGFYMRDDKLYFINSQGEETEFESDDIARIDEQLATKTDMQQATKASMPSDRYIDLTLGESGSTYTAPANGYVYFKYNGDTANIGLEKLFDNNTFCYGITCGGHVNNVNYFNPQLTLYVKAGSKFRVNYIGGTKESFRFIYAEGEV